MMTTLPMSQKYVAIFASYSADGFLPPQVLPYLSGLKELGSKIIIVFDSDLQCVELEKLKPFATNVIVGRHGEYDFGSYKRGIAWARDNGLFEADTSLILCNDSCFGPVGSFVPMFGAMQSRALDFWGVTDSREFSYHLQSYFIVLKSQVFLSKIFQDFIEGVKRQPSVQSVIMNYELGLTRILHEAGFKSGVYIDNALVSKISSDPTYRNITLFPLYTLRRGLPLVKVKALQRPHTNADGSNRVLTYLKRKDNHLYEAIVSDWNIARFEDASSIAFSLIMPTYNRAWCIKSSIRAVLEQTHSNFELIIVDDGSTDDTEDLIYREFGEDVAACRIKYIRLPYNMGVCRARNIGMMYARNSWIGYVDTDNQVRNYFLTMIANSIIAHKDTKIFYGQIIRIDDGKVVGKAFDEKALLKGNYIDLGVFVHRRSLFLELGGFDDSLRRLVDWDLIIRYTANNSPVFISKIFLDYNNSPHNNRISVGESLLKNKISIYSKHKTKTTVSTIILGYNHQEYIVEAIESALEQKGDYAHEIILSDDGSTDGTARIMCRYASRYPSRIRNISRRDNYGISNNYMHCFNEAAGSFIAVLEGDDYWVDKYKNHKQAEIIRSNENMAMIFSRIRLLSMKDNSFRLLKRQENLPKLINGNIISNNRYLNLIANFSSAMFRKSVMVSLPPLIYQPRLNEITLSFYLDRLGLLGFVNEVMSVYRLNVSSAWTGAGQLSQLRQAIAIREVALRVAKPSYKPIILKRLEEKRRELELISAGEV